MTLNPIDGNSTSKVSDLSSNQILQEAKDLAEQGAIYQAKEKVRLILEKNPEDVEGNHLMAELIELEIERQIEMETQKVPEEYTKQEKQDAIKTWLERSASYLEIKQYDEALLAAEKVFLYDPNSIEASTLVDRIRQKAIREGKGESLFLKQMYQKEMHEKINLYLEQAHTWLSQGRTGAAQLALEKTLLLDPENPEALRLYESLKRTAKTDQEFR